MMDRRHFLRHASAFAAAAWVLPSRPLLADDAVGTLPKPPFRISLAQWSLHRTLRSGKLNNLDFAAAARTEFGIDAVEYVNQFFMDKAKDRAYISQMKKRADDQDVTSLLIMCDGVGSLGHPEKDKRHKAADDHRPWLDAAKQLGCHSIRVNAHSSGTYEEQRDRAADGLHRLSTHAAPMDLNVIVENHGGLSSNGAWLAEVIEKVELDNCGTLPDFGNFRLGGGRQYDRYKGVEELMPFAKGVSAKSHEFDAVGQEIHTDFEKMIGIVLEAGYTGYIGIEYEGSKLSESDGIRATKQLLERVRNLHS